jgi:hypothetical protein
MYHCAGGYGPNQFDMIAPIVAWVEQGAAPGKIIATQTDNTGQATRTFPVFSYPEQTKYTGHGNINEANNYVGVMPSPLPDDDYNWLGNDLFHS